ncbi:MAG: aspartate aminotransferase family protein [Xanthobacteraceae bacterium]|nr:aspartate aminotransferase family protein [Xanthobacteraceae bacterium]
MSQSHMMPSYARVDIAFERGEGCWLVTADGQRYLDFGSGVAVNALGHSHPHLVAAITEQAQKVIHVSNLYRIKDGERLADRLCGLTFADLVFFANSGAEAMEGVIKVVRKYQSANGHPERYRIITFEGCFHGRTLATLAAAKNKKHLDGFGPVVDGFDQVPLGDIEAVKKAITPETAGILIEPVQGEGGVRVVEPSFVRALRQICDERGLLLAFDEVQTGIGRLGEMFGYQRLGVTPDVMGLAKGLGAGFPIGAVLTTAEAGKGITPGTHGSTFGGNPLAVAAGNAVLDEVTRPGFLDNVRKMALLFRQRLAEIKDRHPAVIAEVRGEGLLIGLKSVVPNGELADACRAEKLLSVLAGDNVMRLVPPLIVTEAEVSEAIARLDRACVAVERAQQGAKQAAGKQGAVG